MPSTNVAIARHFLTCHDCLQRVYIEAPRGYLNDIKCAACDGNMEWHGMLNGGKVNFEAEAAPCNTLCVDATGKSCVCACGGKNHGSHAIVTFTIEHHGPITVHTLPDDEAIRIATEYRNARSALIDTVRDEWEARRQGKWLDSGAWYRLQAVQDKLSRARKLRTHGNRMKALARA